MHTYLNNENGRYSVGMWLPNHEGVTAFHRMFDVLCLSHALEAVNMLNGGSAEFVTASIVWEH